MDYRAHQAPLTMGFSNQEYWTGLPFPFPGDLPQPGIKPASPALAGGFFTTESLGKSISRYEHSIIHNLIPELLRLNCRPMPNTSWSDTNLPLIVQAPILFCVLFTLIHDKSGREPACQCRRQNRCGLDIWVGKIPWRRAWQPAPVFLPGESHEQRSLVGHRPWGCKYWTWLKQLSMHACTHTTGPSLLCSRNGDLRLQWLSVHSVLTAFIFWYGFQTSVPDSFPSEMHSLPSCLMQLLLTLGVTSHPNWRWHPRRLKKC